MSYDIKIDKDILNVHPGIHLGILKFDAIVKKSNEEFWDYMDKTIIPKARQNIEGKNWNEISGVSGSRDVYKFFGRDPGRYRVSSESLLRRVRRGDELYHINSIVDINNLLSIKSGLSVGSYDLKKVFEPITFRKAKSGEGYNGIGKDFLDMENMLVLADCEGIFGSSMSDSTRAMITEKTTEILVVIYCFDNSIDLNQLLEEGKKAFQEFGDANNIETWIV